MKLLHVNYLIFGFAMAVALSSWSNQHDSQNPIRLFDQSGNFQRNYELLIRTVRDGDIFEFNDGQQFRFKKVLGHGTNVLVWEAIPLSKIHNFNSINQESVALRIPIGKGDYLQKQLSESIASFEKMKPTKLNTPEYYQSMPGEYIAVELVNTEFYENSVSRFLEGPKSFGGEKLWREAQEQLIEFVKDNYDIKSIGDMHPDQLCYDKTNKKWRILDWAGEPVFLAHGELNLETTFLNEIFPHHPIRSGLGNEIVARLKKELIEQRKMHQKLSSFGFCMKKMLK